MNMSTIVLGLLVGLVAPILLGVAMAAAKIASISRGTLTIKKALRKTTTGAGVGSSNATVTKVPERKRDAYVRPAAYIVVVDVRYYAIRLGSNSPGSFHVSGATEFPRRSPLGSW